MYVPSSPQALQAVGIQSFCQVVTSLETRLLASALGALAHRPLVEAQTQTDLTSDDLITHSATRQLVGAERLCSVLFRLVVKVTYYPVMQDLRDLPLPVRLATVSYLDYSDVESPPLPPTSGALRPPLKFTKSMLSDGYLGD